MNLRVCIFLLFPFVFGCESNPTPTVVFSDQDYPEKEQRIKAPINSRFFIDPNSGSDLNTGLDRSKPWKTFKNINKRNLSEGNSIEIISAGSFRESLYLIGEGTLKSPITVSFAEGQYNFYPENAVKRKFHISNTNDAPDQLKSIAIYLSHSKNVQINGHGAHIIFRGKVIEASIDNSENVAIQNISFDYKRPTVSEMKVVSVTDNVAEVEIHEDSNFNVRDEKIYWMGEGWEHEFQKLWQVYDPSSKKVFRKGFPVEKLKVFPLGERKVSIQFDENPGFETGLIYQNRNTFRDYCGFFIQRSKNILWKNVSVNFMHGMGFVSQFSEDIVFDSLYVGVKKNSDRTCAAWADILHFSGCKGNLLVQNSYLSAANDDAINVHGTHLRIVAQESNKKIRVKYMHPQTFGFDPFIKGDSIEFINSKTLLPYSKNVVTEIVQFNDKEYDLILKEEVRETIQDNDVVENSSWTANLTVRTTKIESIPTRGVLVSTRGKVLLEENEFLSTHMSAVLIADDANGWYESGYVKDVSITNNQFITCGSPVIKIHPENSRVVKGVPVHSNIRLEGNFFKHREGLVLTANSTGPLRFIDNIIESKETNKFSELYTIKDCTDVEIQSELIK